MDAETLAVLLGQPKAIESEDRRRSRPTCSERRGFGSPADRGGRVATTVVAAGLGLSRALSKSQV